MNEKDRREHAKRLNLTLKEFDRLVTSANKAYETMKELGPFYGREEIKEPTFRITAEPVTLPKGAGKMLTQLGEDLFHLAQAIGKLPDKLKEMLGANLDYKVPLTWRIDAILDKKGNLRVNEIEGKDGANALMIAEQQAYNLQDLTDSTAAVLAKNILRIYQNKKLVKLALILTDMPNYPHTPNARRFVNFLQELSEGKIKVEMIDENDLKLGKLKPKWDNYDGVLNETSLSPKELFKLGVKDEQLIAAGNHTALVNKGLFALIFDKSMNSFWEKELGADRLKRLKSILIPTEFITSIKQLEEARRKEKVVKISWAEDTLLINRSRGIAMPKGELEQNTEDRWNLIKNFLKKGLRIVAQDFTEPAKVPAFLRKRGITLEAVNWYNRICVKYVCLDSKVILTATEVTLGSNIIPATRECAFTAGKFTD